MNGERIPRDPQSFLETRGRVVDVVAVVVLVIVKNTADSASTTDQRKDAELGPGQCRCASE